MNSFSASSSSFDPSSSESFSYSLNEYAVAIKNNDIQLLKQMKSNNIPMTLLNYEFVNLIKSFNSVDYYEMIEYLLENYIQLDEDIAFDLIRKVLYVLITPKNEQQKSQLEIYKKLVVYKRVQDLLKLDFLLVVLSLNIPLVEFIVNELKITDINGLFYGIYILQLLLVVIYIINNPKIDFKLAFEMFEYLLSIGKDLNKREEKHIKKYILLIADPGIQQALLLKLSNHQTSKY